MDNISAHEQLLNRAAAAQTRAFEIIDDLNLEGAWSAVGAELHLVGSLRMGLLMKHRDIDLHVYSDRFSIEGSFAAMAAIARNRGVQRISYVNLLDTEERCLEWHAWYRDGDGEMWQLDLIHLLRESPYAGHFEKVADRIKAALTPETRLAILSIKDGLPDGGDKALGIEIYQAVLRDGVRDLEGFSAWKNARSPRAGIVDWMP